MSNVQGEQLVDVEILTQQADVFVKQQKVDYDEAEEQQNRLVCLLEERSDNILEFDHVQSEHEKAMNDVDARIWDCCVMLKIVPAKPGKKVAKDVIHKNGAEPTLGDRLVQYIGRGTIHQVGDMVVAALADGWISCAADFNKRVNQVLSKDARFRTNGEGYWTLTRRGKASYKKLAKK